MLPEIFTKIGEVQLALGRVDEAREAFQKARSLKPDYWPAYWRWAEHLSAIGQKAKARELAEEGLSYAPDAKPLRSLLTVLGGNPAAVRARPLPAPTASTEPAK
jgi:tetratricopeptide (TPR) repeat protein